MDGSSLKFNYQYIEDSEANQCVIIATNMYHDQEKPWDMIY